MTNYPQTTDTYRSEYSENKFWTKVKRTGKAAGQKVVYLAMILYYILKADTTPTADKLKIMGALGYLILPIDLIPDFIPVIGYSDDLYALYACYKAVKRNITSAIEAQAKEQTKRIFGALDFTLDDPIYVR